MKKSSIPSPKCLNCGHPESEHALYGTRPCLAVVGDLLHREFCSCGHFQADVALAA